MRTPPVAVDVKRDLERADESLVDISGGLVVGAPLRHITWQRGPTFDLQNMIAYDNNMIRYDALFDLQNMIAYDNNMINYDAHVSVRRCVKGFR